jgi:YD repeat-containing protein
VKRVSRKRWLAATAAGLVGFKPRPGEADDRGRAGRDRGRVLAAVHDPHPGQVVVSLYDAQGQCIGVTVDGVDVDVSRPDWQPAQTGKGGGLVTTYHYDAKGRVTRTTDYSEGGRGSGG